ncbi:MAG: 2-oxoadipate dioxygenase/decarboxylase family protein [Mariniphaga sp.]
MKRSIFDITEDLVEKLWGVFLNRVSYARTYNQMVKRRGGRVVIDHVGFRTLNTHTGEQPGGIWGIRHLIECLGYTAAGKYNFTKKKLKAVHFEPGKQGLPKIFVSQLEVSQLPEWVQPLFAEAVANTPYLLPDSGIELLNRLKTDRQLTQEAADELVGHLARYFRRPWNPPQKDTVLKLNDVSHYAAWVLLHGNAPSHFASLVNEQHVNGWSNLETTWRSLQNAGIPMKSKVEGTAGGLLLQTATQAAKEYVTVKDDNLFLEIPWTYGYLELIERGYDQNDHQALFQNFLEDQENHLYQMTMTLEN